MTKTGKIKWFDFRKKFGFIAADDGDDYFVHQSQFLCEAREIRGGAQVVFETRENFRGPVATNVRIIPE